MSQSETPDFWTLLGYFLMPVFALVGVGYIIENPWIIAFVFFLLLFVLLMFAFFAMIEVSQ